MFSAFIRAFSMQACVCTKAEPPQQREQSVLYAESPVPCVPPKSRRDSRRLSVPGSFTRFQFNVIYTQLGATQGALLDLQRQSLKVILRHFVRELSSGVILSMVDQGGSTADYTCQIDRKLTHIMMHPEGLHHSKVLPFEEIERICSPEEVRNLHVTTPLVIDECCTTILLSHKRCVTFRLESVAAREYLMLCLQVLRMSQNEARMWY
mmetsp:Transcript_26196/g.57620  ORF Transcript_26196/g.57620 Transcript_26196/m.57620 type:complete len:208 (-) Transcript_26196:124-747(-)